MALQALFQDDLGRAEGEEAHLSIWNTQAAPDAREYAEELVRHAVENDSVVEALIRRFTRHWRLERIAAVDRNVLRVAIAEFLFTETPNVVVIDEAVEIARKYGSERSSEFVNGVLDAIREEIERSPHE